jgi:hypothetical protein
MKQADLMDMFKKAFNNVCIPSIVISPDPVSCTPSTSSGVKSLENTGEDPGDPGPANEGDTQMEYFSDWLSSPSVWALTKT